MISRRQFLLGAGGSVVLVSSGCTGENLAASPASPSSSVVPVTRPASTIPSTSQAPIISSTTVPSRASWSAADFADLDRFLEQTDTDALRIVERGDLIHEWYRTDDTFARDVASVQKSVLSLLVGRAIGDGAISLDTSIDDVLGPTWTPHGQSAGITVRHLLTMTSGLDDRFEVIAAPGAEWNYSGAFAALFDVLTTVTGRELNDIAGEWLFEPAGAATAEFYRRRPSRFASTGLLARASDLTAIGQSVVDATQPALADGWLDESFMSGSSMNEAYGYLWWLNGRGSFRLPRAAEVRPGALIPSAPADLVAALGRGDQKLYVSRELELVVSRLGEKATPGARLALSSFDDQLWVRLVDLRNA